MDTKLEATAEERDEDDALTGCKKFSAEGYEWSLKRAIAAGDARCEFGLCKVYAGRLAIRRNADASYHVVGALQSKLARRCRFVSILTIIDYASKEVLLQERKSFVVDGRCDTCKFAASDFVLEEPSAGGSGYRLFVTIKRSAIASDHLVSLVTEVPDPRSKRIEARLAVLESVERLLERQQFCDVKLVSRDGRELLAHRAILAARSSVFAAMFDCDMRERRESVVRIDDLDHDALQSLLDYLYLGEATGLERLAVDVLHAADKYDLAELKALCEERVCRSVGRETALELMVLADRYGCERLKAVAVDAFLRDALQLVDTEAFRSLKKGHAGLLEFVLLRLLKK